MSQYNFAIKAKHLNKSYTKKGKKIDALVDLDISIPKGSIGDFLVGRSSENSSKSMI